MKDFTHLAMIGGPPVVLVVNNAIPVTYLKGFIAYVCTQPDGLYWGSSGQGTHAHLIGEAFRAANNLKMVHISYKGGGQAVLDLLGNQIPAAFMALPSANQHILSGKLTALAVTSSERSSALPDVPTVEQAGGPTLKGYEASSWFGLLAPAGTPQDIVNRIQQEVAKSLATPAMKERLVAQGAIPGGNTPAEFAKHIDNEHKKWAQVVKASGAKVD